MWEHFGDYVFLYFLSFVKYFVTPAIGWARGLSFMEIAISCFAGAYTCFNIFYWASSYFFNRAERKRKEKKKKKKTFTRTNRLVVRMRASKYGFWLITFLCPMFLSVPGGTLIVAKFYGYRKDTFFVTSIFILCWAFILTSAYMFIG